MQVIFLVLCITINFFFLLLFAYEFLFLFIYNCNNECVSKKKGFCISVIRMIHNGDDYTNPSAVFA
jgi:hypothetical protein